MENKMKNTQKGLPKNFDKLSHYDKVLTLLHMAFDYPMEYKVLPLSKLWSIDENVYQNIHNQTNDNSTEYHYNQVIMNSILDFVKKHLAVSK
jgi:hypothetical protein